MLKSYLLLFIHKLMPFALTTNTIFIFIMYLLEFIVVYVLLKWNVFIQIVFLLYLLEMYLFWFIYLSIFIGLDLIFFYSIHVL